MIPNHFALKISLLLLNLFSCSAQSESRGPGNFESYPNVAIPDIRPYQYPSQLPSTGTWSNTTTPSSPYPADNYNINMELILLKKRISELELLVSDQQQLINYYKSKINP